MSRPACVTDYQGLYATNYYAHGAGAASFDTERLPPIIAATEAEFGGAVLDIGGGSGLLAQLLTPLGVKAFTVDAADRQATDFRRIDLSRHDPAEADDIRRHVTGAVGDRWLATCFDVAEHIDREHLADFLLNLSVLAPLAAVLSISTRPSSKETAFTRR
jgi:2-polyprenyl-3-methyl-5-hydroxy-6-metoxy-1,4-benzoquinol methylase